ncbi:hypothetical protein PV702_06500 [Streptomyces sp. FL06-04B]|uniref:hypothetical protein n=1 Tax=Streptomyces TaxID=1883 RepID=UPI0029ABBC87|nr:MULTISPECIES: hypothetical protein [unclassified Streptomyces]MDX3606120.1 hypothetical protein [Streptomyces sp. FL06-04B]MDX3735354.1 hypothetical protein [Streptomyces sp. ID01-15D]
MHTWQHSQSAKWCAAVASQVQTRAMFIGELQIDPPWTFALAEILHASRITAEQKDLNFPAALDQLAAWLDDPREYHNRHRRSWAAAIDDYEFATQGTGPEYQKGLKAHLRRVAQAMTGVPAKGTENQRSQAAKALRELDAEASSCAQLERAWEDVVSAAKHKAHYTTIISRIALLESLLARKGRSALEVRRTVSGILRDQQIDIQMARLSLGDSDSLGHFSPHSTARKSGMAEADRLILCARIITTPPRLAHHVVWHAFAKATIPRMVQEVGPITLYNREWFIGTVEAVGPYHSQLPAEVIHEDGFFPVDIFPDEPNVVLARVDLGTGAHANAPAESRLQALATILAATFPDEHRGWELYEGYIHTVDDFLGGSHAFYLTEEDFATPYRRMDATAKRLERMAPRIAARLPHTSPDLTETVDTIGWWKASATQPPLPAIVLDVRILELLATRVAALDWCEYLNSFHRNSWIRDQVLDTIFQVAWHSTDDLGHFSPEVRNAAREIRSGLFDRQEGDGEYRVNIREAVSILPDLVSVYPQHSKQGMRASEVASRLADAASMQGWYLELDNQWSRLINRLRSVRNSLAHGGPVTPEAAASVCGLAHSLAGTGLADSLNALLEGAPRESNHQRRRQICDKWATSWLTGTPAPETF